MAEVHEITRTAFNQLTENDSWKCEMLCRDQETIDTEWYLASIWAHFGGKACFVWVYPAACEREAVKDADAGNERQLRTVATYEKDGRSLHCAREYEVWHVVDDEPGPEDERPDYYRVDMGGNGSAHFTEYEQACEFVEYMMHQPLDKGWCTFCEVWACWSDGAENWLGDHWRSMFDGRVFHMRDCDALAKLGLI